MDESGKRRSGRRWLILRIIWFGLIAATVYALLPTLAMLPEFVQDLEEIEWWALVLGLLFAVGAQTATVLLFSRSLRTLGAEPIQPLGLLARVWMAESTLTALLPGGSVAGAVVSVDVLRGRGVEAEKTTAAIVLTKIFWWIALLILAVVGLALSLGEDQTSSAYLVGAALIIPFLAVGVGALIIGVLQPSRVVPLVHIITTRASRYRKSLDPDAVSDRAAELLTEAQPMLQGWAIAINGGLALSLWAANVAILEIMLGSLGHWSGLAIAVLAVAIAQVVAVIPITPGGIGVVEIVMVSILTGFGMTSSVAVVAVIAYRVISYWLPLIVGGLSYLSVRGLVSGGHGADTGSGAGRDR